MDSISSLKASQYESRVAIEEISILEEQLCSKPMPHISYFLNNKKVIFLLQELQNLIWTMERFLNKVRTKANIVTFNERVRPSLPADSPLAIRRDRPNVWIDVTNTHRSGLGGGIARSVRELSMAALRSGSALPVFIENGRLYSYFRQNNDLPLIIDMPITYVVIDTFWDPLREYLNIFEKIKSEGGKVVTCVYDLIPFYHPTFFVQELTQAFITAFPTIIRASDGFITISEYSLGKLKKYISVYQVDRERQLALGVFQLGATTLDISQNGVRDIFQKIFSADSKVFLSVGTLEPRKGYVVSIDAFDYLWGKGIECRFVILGRRGWISRALENRITKHREFGERLFWFTDGNDAELAFAYHNTYCVIQASITEGMGLPLVEASMEGAPIIATDNQVFREVATDQVQYFESGNGADLADKIERSLIERPKPARLNYVTWDETLSQLQNFIAREIL